MLLSRRSQCRERFVQSEFVFEKLGWSECALQTRSVRKSLSKRFRKVWPLSNDSGKFRSSGAKTDSKPSVDVLRSNTRSSRLALAT